MSEVKTYPVPADFAAQANITADQYEEMYKRSVEDPAGFWGEQAEQYLTWFKKWDSVLDWSFGKDDLHIEWFKGGKLNVSVNCLDRHLPEKADDTAIIWEGDDPSVDKTITFAEAHSEVCKLANAMKDLGVKKGDRVAVLANNSSDLFEILFACWEAGAAMMPLNWRLTADELSFILKDGGAQTIIFDADFAPVVEKIRAMGDKATARKTMMEVGVRAATDITGFGLAGHALKMAEASQVSYTITGGWDEPVIEPVEVKRAGGKTIK